MWKVLIADDEPKIRRGLKDFIDWNMLGMEVVGEAEDGEIALDAAKRTNPDILLVDICMPFLNGLDFIKQVLEYLPEVIVIVITGHDKFSYVQQAIKLGAFDYLLKPVSKDQIYSVVKKAKEKLDNIRSQNKYIEWANKQFDNYLPMFKEKFFNEWICGKLTRYEIEEQISFLGLSINENSGILLIKVVEKLNFNEAIDEWDRQLLLFAIQNISEELLQDFYPNVLFRDDKDNIVVICKISSTEKWNEVGENIRRTVEFYLKQVIIVIQDVIEEDLWDIPGVYQKLLENVLEQNKLTPIVQLAKNFIDINYYREDLCLDDLTKEIKITSSYISRLLRQELGCSFVEYLTKVRIKKSIQLMNDPTMKIFEIANRVGYNNQHYFSTAFKKVLGIPPGEYRKGVKINF